MNFHLPPITEALLAWYDTHARVLPWRSDRAPYRVWLSEIMLQQTRVETVIPYFERFVAELPDVYALAAVPEDRLLKLWEGLGYYSRARNLQKAARVIVQDFQGQIPADPAELRRLPGIGEYTAGAIGSIAFGLPTPAVDGNVLRVAARLAGYRAPADAPAFKKMVAEALAPQYTAARCGAFTQSLMELGATVCIPNGAPLCGHCPLRPCCQAAHAGLTGEIPLKMPKKQRKCVALTVFLLRCGDRIAIRKRPARGLLAGMWEFPHSPSPEPDAAWGVLPDSLRELGDSTHIFTHLEWHMRNREGICPEPSPQLHWVTPEELRRDYSVPTAFGAILNLFKKNVETSTNT